MKIKIGVKAFLIVIILILISIVFWSLSGYFVKNEDNVTNLDKFAKCLSGKSTLYVSTGCPHCASQKELFGSSVEYLNIIDCRVTQQPCIDNNIQYVPTWVINGENKGSGVKTLDELANLTGCPLS